MLEAIGQKRFNWRCYYRSAHFFLYSLLFSALHFARTSMQSFQFCMPLRRSLIVFSELELFFNCQSTKNRYIHLAIESKSLQRRGGWRRSLEGSPVGTQCVGAGRSARFSATRGLPARGLLAGRAAHTARLGEALAGGPSNSLRPTPSTAQPSLQSLPPAFSHIYSRVYCSLILVQHLNVRCAQEWPKTCALGCLGGQVFASLAVLLARRPLARCCWRSRARPDRAKKV